jgi:hypothetical protein
MRKKLLTALLLVGAGLLLLAVCTGQVSCVARFVMEKDTYLLGEPVFCRFVLQNTGTQTIQFSYRFPTRVLNRDLEQEPHFVITDATGHPLADPAPRPCGGAKGSVLYGWATLSPGQIHTERWLLNEWGRFVLPGRYRARAERRLPVMVLDPLTQKPSASPAAYPMALNELWFTLQPATEEQLRSAFRPYLEALDSKAASRLPEALLAVTTLPQPFFLTKLQMMATAPARAASWDRRQVLEGLARLGTPPAWDTILKIAQGTAALTSPAPAAGGPEDLSLRGHALLLLGERKDKTVLPALLGMVESSPPELRGDVLQTLGFFDDPRASQALFAKLHAAKAFDRVNAILGLRNRENKDVVPALLAMLNDPAAQVRQVAHFALQNLTGQRFALSARASPTESARMAARWRAWWREEGGNFVPVRQPPCRDW